MTKSLKQRALDAEEMLAISTLAPSVVKMLREVIEAQRERVGELEVKDKAVSEWLPMESAPRDGTDILAA